MAFPATVLTVGGTNGKGSVTAYLDAILTAGYETGLFTSPSRARNERIRVHGREVTDDALLAAFAEIDAARGTSLTFFEWNTLAALLVFVRARGRGRAEVGMGGRLDAVNILDADAPRSSGRHRPPRVPGRRSRRSAEKGGNLPRRQTPIGGRTVPRRRGVRQGRRALATHRHGFRFRRRADGWTTWVSARGVASCPPALAGASQLGNAAVALAMSRRLSRSFWYPTAVSAGLSGQRCWAISGHRRRADGSGGAWQHRPRSRWPRACPARPGRGRDHRLRDPGRQGRRGDRRRARTAGRALDRRRTRGSACACARRTCPTHRTRQRRSVQRPRTSRRAWRPRGPKRGRATVSSRSVPS